MRSVFHVREGNNNEEMCHQHHLQVVRCGLSVLRAEGGGETMRASVCSEVQHAMRSCHAVAACAPSMCAAQLQGYVSPCTASLEVTKPYGVTHIPASLSYKAIWCHSHTCIPEHATATCRWMGSNILLHTRRAQVKRAAITPSNAGSKHTASDQAQAHRPAPYVHLRQPE